MPNESNKPPENLPQPQTPLPAESAGQQAQPVKPDPQKKPTGAMLVGVKAEQWAGPLPPPGVLEKFDQVLPGSAKRILKMAENEQQHRISYEREGLAATAGEAKRGQYLGGCYFWWGHRRRCGSGSHGCTRCRTYRARGHTRTGNRAGDRQATRPARLAQQRSS